MAISLSTTVLLFSVFSHFVLGGGENQPCRRECRSGESSRLCEFEFDVEWYTTMGRACFSCPFNSADCERDWCIPASGSQRPIVTANRRLPGPSIEVCKGDRIRVKVHNELQNGETTSIHWHGMRQRRTPWMDGVPMITQCPILPHTSFIYEFEADVAGTYFWHSHSGVQRADGLAGALIVREPNDPHVNLYDVDDLDPVIFHDWYPDDTASGRFATHHYGDADNKPPQILINGHWQASTTSAYKPAPNDPLPPFPVPTAAFEYHLDSMLRYRFRAISNAFLLCPISITIEGHNLMVIATDGQPIKPQITRALVIMPGERYDFVPYFTGEFSSQNVIYWLIGTGLADCAVKKAQGLAKIMYVDRKNPAIKTASEATKNQSVSVADEINSLNYQTRWDKVGDIEKGRMNVVLLDGLFESEERISEKPDVSFVVGMDFEPINNTKLFPWRGVRGQKIYSPRLNHITNRMPPAPLLTQPENVPPELFCNATHRKCPIEEFCECIHTLNAPLNSLVELILVDTGRVFAAANHPSHLHGYTFQLVGMDQMHTNLSVEEFLEADRKGEIKRKFSYSLPKDTITVPSGGYAIVRFVADNPGVWLMHCHIDYHMEIGMTLAIRVGPHQAPKLPSDFPRCGSWSAPHLEPIKSNCNKIDCLNYLVLLLLIFLIKSSFV